jgi:exportin-1
MASSTSPAVPDAAAKLLDFSQPFDVALLDATVNAFYGAGSNDEVRERE